MAQLEQISGCLGHLEMDGDGNIIKSLIRKRSSLLAKIEPVIQYSSYNIVTLEADESGGDMEYQEELATRLYQLYTKCVEFPLDSKDELRRVSVNYNDICYLLVSSHGHLYIIKKACKLQETASV